MHLARATLVIVPHYLIQEQQPTRVAIISDERVQHHQFFQHMKLKMRVARTFGLTPSSVYGRHHDTRNYNGWRRRSTTNYSFIRTSMLSIGILATLWLMLARQHRRRHRIGRHSVGVKRMRRVIILTAELSARIRKIPFFSLFSFSFFQLSFVCF